MLEKANLAPANKLSILLDPLEGSPHTGRSDDPERSPYATGDYAPCVTEEAEGAPRDSSLSRPYRRTNRG